MIMTVVREAVLFGCLLVRMRIITLITLLKYRQSELERAGLCGSGPCGVLTHGR